MMKAMSKSGYATGTFRTLQTLEDQPRANSKRNGVNKKQVSSVSTQTLCKPRCRQMLQPWISATEMALTVNTYIGNDLALEKSLLQAYPCEDRPSLPISNLIVCLKQMSHPYLVIVSKRFIYSRSDHSSHKSLLKEDALNYRRRAL